MTSYRDEEKGCDLNKQVSLSAPGKLGRSHCGRSGQRGRGSRERGAAEQPPPPLAHPSRPGSNALTAGGRDRRGWGRAPRPGTCLSRGSSPTAGGKPVPHAGLPLLPKGQGISTPALLPVPLLASRVTPPRRGSSALPLAPFLPSLRLTSLQRETASHRRLLLQEGSWPERPWLCPCPAPAWGKGALPTTRLASSIPESSYRKLHWGL